MGGKPQEQSVCKAIPRTMDRWVGKIAIVTGASVGIGAATVTYLVNHGVKVVGLARSINKLEELSTKLGKHKFYAVQCDVTKEEDILRAFKWIEKELGGAHILVNNAGIAHQSMIIDMPTEEYRKVIETNLIAPAICAREFVQSIRKRNASGHIININSIVGQFAEAIQIPLGMYCPSKYGLRALGVELRHEIIESKLPIKLTNISPGAVLTNLLKDILYGEESLVNRAPKLQDKNIAEAVIYVLGTPEGVEIHELTIMPQNALIGGSKPILLVE